MARLANKLTRQVTRHLGGPDASAKMLALADLLKDKPEIYNSCLPLLTGFEAFLEAVQEAYAQFEDKNKMAIRNLQLSSDELNKVNRKLEFLNSSMNAMLESLGPGLLFFDKAGVCSTVFSKSCRNYLESDPGGKYIWDVLGLEVADTESFVTLIKYTLENDSAMSFEDLMSLAPKIKTHSDGRTLHLEYRPMRGFGRDMQGVLVIITDRTHEEEARRLLEEKDKAASRILRLAKNRNGFQQFIRDIHSYFLNGDYAEYKSEGKVENIVRMVHTFKGLAGTFFAGAMSDTLHTLEEDLARSGKLLSGALNVISSYTKNIDAASREMVRQAETLFGTDFIARGETKTISAGKLNNFHAMLSDANPDLAHIFMQEFLTVSIREVLAPLDFYMQELAPRHGKKIAPVQFKGDDFWISEAPYAGFINSLVHIASNIVDHGIEEVELRQMVKKPEAGQVVIRTEQFERNGKPWFRLTFKDDGAGIDKEAVRMKAGLSNEWGDKEILEQIFQPGFTTRSHATHISGRGVGLNALYEEVKALGGTIAVESETGAGTRFTIELPVIISATPDHK